MNRAASTLNSTASSDRHTPRSVRSPLAALPLAIALALSAPAATVIGVGALITPEPALAQRTAVTPQIDRLEIGSDSGLTPGAELDLRLFGTPRGHAAVRIQAAKPINIVLHETYTGSGEYTARYTIKRVDRLATGQRLRATLRHGKRSTSANYTIPASAVAGTPPPASALAPRIDRFSIAPVSRLSPGTELIATLEGVAGAQASFDIGDVASDIPMRELRPGVYEGRYTLRRQDRMTRASSVVASLRTGTQVTRAQLSQPLIADTSPPTVVNLAPRENERVAPGVVYVSGNLEDASGTGVDPKSVRLTLNGRDVTRETQITAQSFSYRNTLPAGAYTALLTANDAAGNSVRREWRFDVGAAAHALAIELSSPTGDTIDGRTPVTIRGRTAPGATVHARVTGLLQVVGPVGLEQEVLNQQVVADRAGNFSLQFQPTGLPGSRYDLVLVASQDGRSEETRMRLNQP